MKIGKKGKIKTNVRVEPSVLNGLSKLSLADCLQTRPIDQLQRLVVARGELETEVLRAIEFPRVTLRERAFKAVFGLV